MKINLTLYGIDAVLIALVGCMIYGFINALKLNYIKTAYCLLLPAVGLAVIGFVELIGTYRKTTQHRITGIAIVLKRYHLHKISQKLALTKIDDLFLNH